MNRTQTSRRTTELHRSSALRSFAFRPLAIAALTTAACLLVAPFLASSAAASVATKPITTTTTTTTATKATTTTTTATKATTTTTAPKTQKATTTTTTAAPVAKPAAVAAGSTTFPADPPAVVCGNTALLSGPVSAPSGAVSIAAGDNSLVNWNRPGTTFWFASGTHTLGSGQYNQIITAANTTFLGAPGAVIDGRGVNQYAFTQISAGVTIRYLTIQGFVAPRDEGVVNHDSGANWTIQYNTIVNNTGAGLMVGPGDVVSYNCMKANGQYGFSAYKAGGDSNITIDHNEIEGNNTGNWDVVIPGCGCVGGGKVWNTVNGAITNNWIHNNIGPGLWADTDNAGILIDGNYIADNDEEAIIYEISYNAQITNNNILRNTIVKGKAFAAQSFPVGSVYISESGGDSRVNGGLYSTMNIAGNNLVDNWGGITLWENADRFCGSPANTSSTFCTSVNPAANFSTCVAGTINNPPYLADCRWKTQNISVHDNTFAFSRANVGCTGTTAGCGEQAILSNYGTTPSWSPYLGNTIINTIANQQNNHYANNTYTGDWKFVAGGGEVLNSSSWQGSPYNQDTGSTFNGVDGAPQPNNLLDADTSTAENSIGRWIPWFAAGVAQSSTQAQSGTHSVQVNITAAYGWGIGLSNWPGFTASAGAATVSFFAMSPAAGLNASMAVQWRNAAGTILSTSNATLSNISSTWQQATANATAPAGTAFASVTFTGTTGSAGNALYLDQVAVIPGTAVVTPPSPPSGTTINLLDTDTSTLEGSAGRWVPWFSSNVAQNATHGHSGTHSLQVTVTAPYGWGVAINSWPGFAANPGPQTVGFWALLGSGNLSATMTAQWRDVAGTVLATTPATMNQVNASWQQATVTGTAPSGTAYVSVTFTAASAAGTSGNSMYLDDIVVGTPAGVGVNLLDADTATAEGSVGHWIPWFASTVAQTTAQAQGGTHSIQAGITGAGGWGMQLNTWPGFAAAPGPQSVAFWAMGTAGLNVTMQVQWRDVNGNLLTTSVATLPSLTSTWQTAGVTATAPAGTAFARVAFTGTNGVAGNTVYLDQIYVGS